jgi:hypothetical protein
MGRAGTRLYQHGLECRKVSNVMNKAFRVSAVLGKSTGYVAAKGGQVLA